MQFRGSAFAKQLRAMRLPVAIGVFGICVLVLLWAGLIFEGRHDRDVALAEARTDTANLVIAFREDIRRTFTAIDQVMLAIKAEAAQNPEYYHLPNWLAESRFLAGLAVQVGIIGADGFMRESDLGDPSGRPLDLSDREHFRYHLDPSRPQPYISKPVLGRFSGKMSVQISRRLETTNGRFAGVLVVSLDPSYLSQFFETIDVGNNGVIALIGNDGVVRARRARGSSEIGQDLSGTTLFEQLPKASHGTFIAEARTDGRERIYSYAAVPDYPLIVAVGLGLEDIFAPIDQAYHAHIAFGAVLSLVLLLLTGLLLLGTLRGQRREKAITDQAFLLQSILDVTPAGIWVKDGRGRFEMLNQAMTEIFGRRTDEIIGRSAAEMIPPDAARQVQAWDDAALADAKMPVVGEHSFLRNGEPCTYLTYRRACNIAGRWRVIGSAMDITSLRRTEEALREEMEQREATEAELRQAQKMEAVGKLTGGIAHDFNNFLTVISGNLDLARARIQDPATLQLLEKAARGAKRGADLIQHLLAFARKQHLEPKPIDLNLLIVRMAELLEPTLGNAVRIETRLDDRLWWGLADASQVESAIVNVAINARDAMPAGGRLLIETANCPAGRPGLPPELSSTAEYVLITIADNGTGMSSEVLAKVFDPFFTTKEVDKGTGLGLSQVYGLARQSGGTVRIDSALGRGTSVRLYLPRAAGRQPDDGAVEVATPRPRHAGLRVLVVDDDESVRDFAAACLTQCGHRVIEAGSGPIALDLLETTPVDIMLLDMVMPKMAGAEVARLARQLRADLPVIFMTGAADAQSLAGELGPIIQKPFRLSVLIADIDRLLDRRDKSAALTAGS